MAEAVYCTLANVQSRLSVAGVSAHLDDGADDGDDVIDEASAIVEEYLRPHYTPTVMADNRWVTLQCSTIAAVLLMQRRGNDPPRSLRRKYEETLEKLEAVSEGRKQIPGLSRRRASIPVLSHPRVMMGPGGPLVVIDRYRGSPQPSPPIDYRQPRDVTEPPRPPGAA